MDDKQLTIQRWILKANRDLLTAQTMIKLESVPTDVVCFHCQQCMEKLIKSFLVETDQDFPKTHDLQRLLQLCIAQDESFRSLSDCAISLNDYAVETRYVDDWREIPIKEAIEAIDKAMMARDFILNKLKFLPSH